MALRQFDSDLQTLEERYLCIAALPEEDSLTLQSALSTAPGSGGREASVEWLSAHSYDRGYMLQGVFGVGNCWEWY